MKNENKTNNLIYKIGINPEEVVFEEVLQDIDNLLNRKPSKRHTILRSLVLEFILTIFFAGVGVPAIFRKRKLFGFSVQIIFAINLTVFLLFWIWQGFILSALLYVFELGIMTSKIIIFARSRNYGKKFAKIFDEITAEEKVYSEI